MCDTPLAVSQPGTLALKTLDTLLQRLNLCQQRLPALFELALLFACEVSVDLLAPALAGPDAARIAELAAAFAPST